MLQRYKVRDESSGRVVEFEWNDPTPPTDADMEEVFAAAEETKPSAPTKSALGWTGNLIKGLAGIPVGMAQTVMALNPVVRGAMSGNPDALTTLADTVKGVPGAIAEDVKQNWSSADAIKERLYNDPVWVAMDASTVLTGVGGLGRIAATKAPALLRASQAASRAGRAIDPALAVARGVQKVAPSADKMRKAAESLYTSALKSSDIQARGLSDTAAMRLAGGRGIDDKQRALSRIGLRERATVGDPGGVAKLENVGDALHQEQKALAGASQATRRGRDIVPGLRQRVAQREALTAAEPSGQYVAAAKKTLDNFLEDPRVSQQVVGSTQLGVNPATAKGATVAPTGQWVAPGPPVRLSNDLKATDVLDMKQDLSRTLKADFTSLTPNPFAESKQVLRHDLKAAAEDMVPGIKPLSEREHEVIALREALENRAKNFNRQNMLSMRHGIGSYIFGQQGDTVRNAIAAYFGSRIDDPTYLSRAALKLEHGIAPKVGQFWKGAERGARASTLGSADLGGGLIRDAIMQAMQQNTEIP